MQLTIPEYLSQINRAKDKNILDWESPSANRYEASMGRLTVIVEKDATTGRWQWSLRHDTRGTLTMGDSESAVLAQQEALLYAQDWVRNAMVGVLA